MILYLYKITLYNIYEEHYATVMYESLKEPADVYREYDDAIKSGSLGKYANRCSVTRIARENLVHDYPEFLMEQAS